MLSNAWHNRGTLALLPSRRVLRPPARPNSSSWRARWKAPGGVVQTHIAGEQEEIAWVKRLKKLFPCGGNYSTSKITYGLPDGVRCSPHALSSERARTLPLTLSPDALSNASNPICSLRRGMFQAKLAKDRAAGLHVGMGDRTIGAGGTSFSS